MVKRTFLDRVQEAFLVLWFSVGIGMGAAVIFYAFTKTLGVADTVAVITSVTAGLITFILGCILAIKKQQRRMRWLKDLQETTDAARERLKDIDDAD